MERARAEWFAKRGFTGPFGSAEPLVIEAQLPPKAICAAWLYEREIVVIDPAALIDSHPVPLLGLPRPW